jgi:hypothetical protein
MTGRSGALSGQILVGGRSPIEDPVELDLSDPDLCSAPDQLLLRHLTSVGQDQEDELVGFRKGVDIDVMATTAGHDASGSTHRDILFP